MIMKSQVNELKECLVICLNAFRQETVPSPEQVQRILRAIAAADVSCQPAGSPLRQALRRRRGQRAVVSCEQPKVKPNQVVVTNPEDSSPPP